MSARDELYEVLKKRDAADTEYTTNMEAFDAEIGRLEAVIAAEAEEVEGEDDAEPVELGEQPVEITVLINGENVGSVNGNMLLGVVIQEFGARHGLRTVIAFNGETKLTADQATTTLEDLNVTKLDIRTKDQRAEFHIR